MLAGLLIVGVCIIIEQQDHVLLYYSSTMSMQCFRPPPPAGQVTVTEYASEFLYSAPDEIEAALNAAGIQVTRTTRHNKKNN